MKLWLTDFFIMLTLANDRLYGCGGVIGFLL
jgi:hypothetical protein